MCEELGYEVKKLMRIRVMNIELGDLAVGKWRDLTNTEIAQLKTKLQMGGPLKESERRISFE
jgi:23S rRNA pseudouridine2604 synthase